MPHIAIKASDADGAPSPAPPPAQWHVNNEAVEVLLLTTDPAHFPQEWDSDRKAPTAHLKQVSRRAKQEPKTPADEPLLLKIPPFDQPLSQLSSAPTKALKGLSWRFALKKDNIDPCMIPISADNASLNLI